MNTLVVLLQIGLAAILILEASGKFRDLPGSRQAVEDFGVPTRWASPVGTGLPVIELALGLGMLVGVTARLSALLAGLLFLAFVAAIGYNLSKGRQPECHCFGQLHSEPAGWPMLVRNLVLSLATLTIVWQGTVGPVEWFDGLSRDGEALVIVGLAMLSGIAGLWLLLRKMVSQNELLIKQNGELSGAINVLAALASEPADPEAETGDDVPEVIESVRHAPDFDIPTLDGDRLSLALLREGSTRALLVFADPGCGPCKALTPNIAEWQQRFGSELRIAVISRGSEEDNREKFLDKGVHTVGIQEELEVYHAFEVRGTPSAVLIEADGTIAQPYAAGRHQIRGLVSRTMSGHDAVPSKGGSSNPGSSDPDDMGNILRKAEGPEVGTPAPRLPLPDLNGDFASLDDYLGEPAVVVFWNVTCGFCQRMIPDLKEIEAEAGDKLSRVMIASQGDVDANRKQGLASRLVIDEGFALGKAFGAAGTPAAIRLDAEGKVTSSLAIGVDAVLDMLGEALELDSEESPDS